MTIPAKLAEAFNKQVTAEIEASLVYLQLSYALNDLGLTGMSSWMKAQAEEEQTHAQMFADHLLDRDFVPNIGDIAAPSVSVKTAEDAFEASLAHEKKVSGMIRELAALAQAENDFDSRPLLDTFLAEQIEEEATVKEILDRLRLVSHGQDGSGLLRIDAELGARNDG